MSARGLIGSHMLDDILACGLTVMAVDGLPLSSEFADSFNPMARFVRGSVPGQELIARLKAAIFTIAGIAQAQWVNNVGARQNKRHATLEI